MNEIKTQNQIGIRGAYAYQVIDDATGDVVVDVPEQCNLVLDSFLALGRTAPQSPRLVIGAGVVTPPSVTDTDLGNQVAEVGAAFTGTQRSEDTDFVYFRTPYTVDFTNLNGVEVSEVGIRNGLGGVLVTRALIKNAQGVPASVTVNTGQTLRLTYALYTKLPKIISTGTIATPHGPLNWSMRLPNAFNSGNYLVIFGGAATSQNQNDWRILSTPPGANGTTAHNCIDRNDYSVDSENRVVTRTLSYPAISTDRSLGMSDTWGGWHSDGWWVFIGGSSTAQYSLFTDRQFILPANYDFSITYTTAWGRIE